MTGLKPLAVTISENSSSIIGFQEQDGLPIKEACDRYLVRDLNEKAWSMNM